jgi:hypothetical protein
MLTPEFSIADTSSFSCESSMQLSLADQQQATFAPTGAKDRDYARGAASSPRQSIQRGRSIRRQSQPKADMILESRQSAVSSPNRTAQSS